jgi:predicted DNA-binding protein with PD1-like motif
MKIIIQDNRRFILRFDENEPVLQGLADFLAAQKIEACAFNGLGTVVSVELGFYNSHLKEFRKKPFIEDFEVVSLTGNGALLAADGKPIVHAHGVFSRIDFSLIGGHIFELLAGATCEIFITKIEGGMKRDMNSDFNLNLLV